MREIPYAIEYKGRATIIYPEDMMDKKCGVKGCSICQEYELKYDSHGAGVNLERANQVMGASSEPGVNQDKRGG